MGGKIKQIAIIEKDVEDIEAADFFGESLKLSQAIRDISEDIKFLTERELSEKIKITPKLWEIRRRFNEARIKAKQEGSKTITARTVYMGTYTETNFYTKVLPDPYKLAWMILPIVDHRDICDEIMRFQLEKMREFVRTTEISEKNIHQMLKILDYVTNHSVGQATQKIQIQSKNVNVEMNAKELPPTGDNLDISKRLEDAKARLMEAPRDVGPAPENES